MKHQAIAKPAVHIIQKDLLQPHNPITVNLIGAGGTGGQVLNALIRINSTLIALNHPGLMVRLWDDDVVDVANLGRQLFATAELGQYKSAVLINRTNLFFGTNWKAEIDKYDKSVLENEKANATITISCVDTVAARFEIGEILTSLTQYYHGRTRVKYWLDFGNSHSSGQVILSTLDKIKQPESEKFRPVETLRLVTEEFKELLLQSEQQDDTPSCSLAEALTKQDLFINPILANCGSELLWQMFREGMLFNRGLFLNLRDFRITPLKVA